MVYLLPKPVGLVFLWKAAWRRSSKVNQVLQGYYAYCQIAVTYSILALLKAVGFSMVRIYTQYVSLKIEHRRVHPMCVQRSVIVTLLYLFDYVACS